MRQNLLIPIVLAFATAACGGAHDDALDELAATSDVDSADRQATALALAVDAEERPEVLAEVQTRLERAGDGQPVGGLRLLQAELVEARYREQTVALEASDQPLEIRERYGDRMPDQVDLDRLEAAWKGEPAGPMRDRIAGALQRLTGFRWAFRTYGRLVDGPEAAEALRLLSWPLTFTSDGWLWPAGTTGDQRGAVSASWCTHVAPVERRILFAGDSNLASSRLMQLLHNGCEDRAKLLSEAMEKLASRDVLDPHYLVSALTKAVPEGREGFERETEFDPWQVLADVAQTSPAWMDDCLLWERLLTPILVERDPESWKGRKLSDFRSLSDHAKRRLIDAAITWLQAEPGRVESCPALAKPLLPKPADVPTPAP